MRTTTATVTGADAELAQRAVELAAKWLREAMARETAAERRQGQSMARMMDDPAGKALTFALADQVFRPPSVARSARRFRDLVRDNFKRMLHEGCRPDNARVVRLGVASHNLFDLAYATVLCQREGVAGRVDLEMLEGMANQQARVVHAATGGLLLYAPVVRKEDFHSAIAYLVRRLDENTTEGNFLHDLFGMEPGDAQWQEQARRFQRACERKDPSALFCESNVFRYRAFHRAVLRVGERMSDRDLARVVLAATVAHVPLEISLAQSRAWFDRAAALTVHIEDEAALAARLAAMPRAWDVVVRAPATGDSLRRAAHECGARLVDHPVVLNGRIELLPLLREQSISETLHRLGNVLPKPAQVHRN